MTTLAPLLSRSNSIRTLALTGIFLVSSLLSSPVQAAGASHTPFIQGSWIRGFKDMTAQLIGEMVHMTGAIGALIDGETANTYQLAMQRLQAQALRDYTPGENLCRLGTLTRALSASESNAKTANVALQTMMMDRETANTSRSIPLTDNDDLARRATLAELYCNPGDNDKTPAACNCDLTAGTCDATAGPETQRANRDLDFARLFDSRLTLKLNFSDDKLTPDEQDVLAFLSNVSAYKTLPAIARISTKQEKFSVIQRLYFENRSLTAARGLVRNTLVHEISQKAPGTDSSSAFLLNVLRELGMSNTEAQRYLETENMILARGGGDATEDIAPSYNAQMEILTKKLYQNPNFYTNLIDKPANVERTRAALKAISLMQRRDMKELLDRRELLLAQLMEFDLRTHENHVRRSVGYAINTGD